MAKSKMHKQIDALIDSLPIDKKEIVFINRLKGDEVPKESDNKLIIVFDIGDE